MTTETIHPDSIEAGACAVRKLGIEIARTEEVEVKKALIAKLAKQLEESRRGPEIAQYLFETAPQYLETQPGHSYGVYVRSNEMGKGSLFAVQIIAAESDSMPILHEHSIPETTLLVAGRIQSVMEISGQQILVEASPLLPLEIPSGIPHGVRNPGPIDSIGFCIR